MSTSLGKSTLDIMGCILVCIVCVQCYRLKLARPGMVMLFAAQMIQLAFWIEKFLFKAFGTSIVSEPTRINLYSWSGYAYAFSVAVGSLALVLIICAVETRRDIKESATPKP